MENVYNLISKFRKRVEPSINVALTKIFLGGIFWQSFALLADVVFHTQHRKVPFSTSLNFCIAVGLGDAIGVVIGTLLLNAYMQCTCVRQGEELPSENCSLWKICFSLSFGCVLSGGAWQVLVDFSVHSAWCFETALCFTGLSCGFCFFLGITAGRAIVDLPRNTFKDFTLALASSGSSGFFVGTDKRYHGNWLSPIVGERQGHGVTDVFKAGLSVLLGFLAVQFMLAWILPDGKCWVDEDLPTESVSATLLQREDDVERESATLTER